MSASAPLIDTRHNVLAISRDAEISWNGVPVTLEQLETVLKQTQTLEAEPHLEFRPHAEAGYDISAEVLNLVMQSGVTKFGFIGNEKVIEENPPD